MSIEVKEGALPLLPNTVETYLERGNYSIKGERGQGRGEDNCGKVA